MWLLSLSLSLSLRTVRDHDYQTFPVYNLALQFISLMKVVIQELPRRSGLADQLNRAAISIPLNIAEGSGEFSKREKARFYRIARRSALECASILDICDTLQLGDQTSVNQGRAQLKLIVAMLTGLARRFA